MENSILNKIKSFDSVKRFIDDKGCLKLYYHNAPRYFLRFMDKAPYFYNDKVGVIVSPHIKTLIVDNESIGVCLNSSLFYWWFIKFSNCRDLVMREIESFPIRNISERYLFDELLESLISNSHRKETFYKSTGKVIYDEFYPKLSKDIIDKIDKVLSKYYDFTDEELDFIINYDIKYRMGDELNNEEEE